MRYTSLILIILVLLALACRKDNTVASQGVELRFSADTVFLDTVFNTVGSSTYTLKIFNPSRESVIIDEISLGRGAQSAYRININGRPGPRTTDLEILPRDSIYVFVEITPSEVLDPMEYGHLYVDSITVSNRGTRQDVKLVTLVRDAHFHFPTHFIEINGVFIPYSNLDCSQTWTGDKPHVIYGYARLDSSCVLNINTGAEVYFYQNSGLWVDNGASLRVGDNSSMPGTGDSVTFAGDRQEPFYENIPGQWGGPLGGIFISGGSQNNSIRNAVIKNATTALRLDSTLTKNLDISYTYILNSSRTAIFGGYGNMEAHSLVVANAGLHLFYAFGGNYEFLQTTFANYWDQSTRTTAAVTLSNYLDVPAAGGGTQRLVRDLERAYFGNCLITGNNRQELDILNDNAGQLEYLIDHAIIDVTSDPSERGFDVSDPTHFQNISLNEDPDFRNTNRNNYDLDSASQAVNQASPAILPGNITLDILGRSRNFNGLPDLGAFERQY